MKLPKRQFIELVKQNPAVAVKALSRVSDYTKMLDIENVKTL